MTERVMQNGNDDCMRACLATYFSCALNDTPTLNSNNWIQEVREWVRAKGFGFVTIAVPNEDVFKETFSDGFLIVSGKSRRGRDHAVIYKDGELWHDPYSFQLSSGIEKVEQVDFFYPLRMPTEPSGSAGK